MLLFVEIGFLGHSFRLIDQIEQKTATLTWVMLKLDFLDTPFVYSIKLEEIN